MSHIEIFEILKKFISNEQEWLFSGLGVFISIAITFFITNAIKKSLSREEYKKILIKSESGLEKEVEIKNGASNEEINNHIKSYILYEKFIGEALKNSFGDKIIKSSFSEKNYDFVFDSGYKKVFFEAKYMIDKPVDTKEIQKYLQSLDKKNGDLWFLTNTYYTKNVQELLNKYNQTHINKVYAIDGVDKDEIHIKINLLKSKTA